MEFIIVYVLGVVIGFSAGAIIEEEWEKIIGRSLVWPVLVGAYLTRSCVRALDYSMEVLFNLA